MSAEQLRGHLPVLNVTYRRKQLVAEDRTFGLGQPCGGVHINHLGFEVGFENGPRLTGWRMAALICPGVLPLVVVWPEKATMAHQDQARNGANPDAPSHGPAHRRTD